MRPPLETNGFFILDEFDVKDSKNIGRPFYFDLKLYLATIEMMICSDEIQSALWLLDNPPGWYRDNYPKELAEIKARLYQQCYDQFDYASDQEEVNFTREEIEAYCLSGYTVPRGDVLKDEIEKLNAQGEAPFIFEISPANGWLPLGFTKRGFKFNYFTKDLNQRALDRIRQWLPLGVWQSKPKPGQTKILVCFETLEHLWNPHDLEQAAKKVGIDFDQVFLSTPKYTLYGGLPNWKTRRIGHIRTWTPHEFLEFAHKSFKGYSWTLYDSNSMVLKGTKTP